MANPQKENGYTAIANEVLEALAKININGEARRVLDVVLRKTYGFQKHQDQISLSQFVLSTQIKRPNVIRALSKLKSMKLIIQIDNEKCNIYRFNKDFDTWVSLSKQIQGVSKQITSVIQMDNESLSKQIHTKEIKETITKETLSAKPRTEREWANLKRMEKGKQPLTPRKATPKQKEALDAFKSGVDYFKQVGYEQQGMMFMEVNNEKRNAAIRKLVINAQKIVGDLKPLIDWWFQGNGEFANYEPEACFSGRIIERFKNSNKKPNIIEL